MKRKGVKQSSSARALPKRIDLKKRLPDYKDLKLLGSSISSCGRITSVAHSHGSYYQRKLGIAIKRARFLALLPYTGSHCFSELTSIMKSK